MDIIEHNRRVWNRQSIEGSAWATPVGPEVIAAARRGEWSLILTPTRAVPREWLGDVRGRDVLCLASGGGQQAPVLAAAGARVTSFDLSDEQLERDREVARRDGLSLQTVRGDMRDLGAFADASFDLVFHPISNVFCPDVLPVWRECHRVLRPGGRLLAGMMNPCFFLFDHDALERGEAPVATYALPYRDPESLSDEARRRWEARGIAAEFSHSLDAQLGGQIAAGFTITGFYEDRWTAEATPLERFFPVCMATLAVRGCTREVNT